MVNSFDKHLEEANRFVKDLALQLGNPENTDQAIRVLRAVFIALRNRIPPDESMHVVSQLPMILKGMYVDGWDLHQPLSEAQTWDEFLFELRNHTARNADFDFANDEDARQKVSTVFTALKQYISEGELDHVRSSLPKEIAEVIA